MANPDKSPTRPTVPQVVPLLRDIYASHVAGCCLHILTDDGNIDDDDAQYCLDCARSQGHSICIAAAEMLVQMTKTQRLKARMTWFRA